MTLRRSESRGKAATISKISTRLSKKILPYISRERVTAFTQVSSDPTINLVPEFVFKGTGKRPPTLDTPEGSHYQWAPKGSNRLEHLLVTINNLPNRFNIFSHAGFAIYVLDDYAVHLQPEARKALRKRGYALVVIGGGITGSVEVNDTHLHKPLKAAYRRLSLGFESCR